MLAHDLCCKISVKNGIISAKNKAPSFGSVTDSFIFVRLDNLFRLGSILLNVIPLVHALIKLKT